MLLKVRASVSSRRLAVYNVVPYPGEAVVRYAPKADHEDDVIAARTAQTYALGKTTMYWEDGDSGSTIGTGQDDDLTCESLDPYYTKKCMTRVGTVTTSLQAEWSDNFTHRITHLDDRAGMETFEALEAIKSTAKDYKEGRTGVQLRGRPALRLREGRGSGSGSNH